MMALPPADPPISSHGYGPDVVNLFLRVVLSGVSLRGTSRVLETLNEVLNLHLPVPCWTTGRLWLLRLGYARLKEALVLAHDWAWLMDHSVQIGPEKCLVILGIRLCDLPPRGQSLRHENLKLVALVPGESWTRAQVDQALEKAVERTGRVPRVIVDDHGVDVHGGVQLFQRRHAETVEIYDTKHKAACLLKHRLENNARWRAFQTGIGQTRSAVQQTELAFLTPPGPKPKARFMNLGCQLAWARRILVILCDPSRLSAVQPPVSLSRLEEKLGWMVNFSNEIAQWGQWQEIIDRTVTWTNQQGLYRGTARPLARQLRVRCPRNADPSAVALAAELVRFVRSGERRTRPGERFPASTEVLESCFGKFKQLEKQQSRSGFTQLLLGVGALLTKVTSDTVREAMQTSSTAAIKSWAREELGMTVFAQRKMAFARAIETG